MEATSLDSCDLCSVSCSPSETGKLGNRKEEKVNKSSVVFCTTFAMIVPETGFNRNLSHLYYEDSSVHMLL